MPDIKCANCGCGITFERENDFFTCPFCSSTLYIGKSTIIRHFYYSPVITAKRACAIFSGEMKKNGFGSMEVLSVEPVMLPFLRDPADPASVAKAAFTPHPAFFEEFRLPSGEPLLFMEKEREWGKIVLPSEESLWLVGVNHESGNSLYHMPFYEISFGTSKNRSRAFVDCLGGNVFMEPLPLSVSTEQANRVLRYLLAYFLFFAAASILIKPAAVALVLTLMIAVPLSPLLAGLVMRRLR